MLNTCSQTSMARTSLGPQKLVRDMVSLSIWMLIMMPGQEASGDNVVNLFPSSRPWWYVECTQWNCLNEAVIMSTHIQFHDK